MVEKLKLFKKTLKIEKSKLLETAKRLTDDVKGILAKEFEKKLG